MERTSQRIWSIVFFILFFGMIFVSLKVFSQEPTFKLVNGKVVPTTRASIAKKPDSVYCTQNGITFYKGPRGGIYYYRVNKAGTKVKTYVKKG